MRKIFKKVLPEYFQAILDGKKKYELRLNNFDIEEGDFLILEECENKAGIEILTGRTIQKQVTYLRNLNWKIYGGQNLRSMNIEYK